MPHSVLLQRASRGHLCDSTAFLFFSILLTLVVDKSTNCVSGGSS